nr:MAG TPA: hypothetical protein [Crassvirales sp.]
MLSTKNYSPSIDIYYDFSYEAITVFSMICIFSCHSFSFIISSISIRTLS